MGIVRDRNDQLLIQVWACAMGGRCGGGRRRCPLVMQAFGGCIRLLPLCWELLFKGAEYGHK
jgi:hypothetical protein